MLQLPRARTLLILASLIAVARPLPACLNNIATRSLWHGTHRAELILVAKLVDIEVNEVALGVDWANAQAEFMLARAGIDLSLPFFDPMAAFTLEATETLKGPPIRRVTFRLPGIYSEDRSGIEQQAVYFLHREEGVWRLSRSPIFLREPRDLADLRVAIRSAVKLGRSASDASELDWHVEATARGGTRAYAAERLVELAKGDPLPPAALRRLAEAFVDDPTPEEAFPKMLTLLESYASPDVDRAAKAAWNAMAEDSWARRHALPLLAARSGTVGLGR